MAGQGINIQDVEALDQFRMAFAQYRKELEEMSKLMCGNFKELGEVWRDQMYGKLKDSFEKIDPGITRYLEETEGTEQYLGELVQRMRAVLELGV